jgi:glutamate formiminotransferase/glutamate formiminotransferase/formiminotetrahydrofolate cyclodeaminase
MDRLVECVPNFSEGRDADKVRALVASVRAVRGVFLLDEEMDADHHRSVLTFVGQPESVAEAAFQVTKVAAALIDLRQHQGGHPRVGATDVVPFVPIRGVTMEDCVALAKKVGQRIGKELSIPVFLYERAASRPDRAPLESIRLGGLEGLADRMKDSAWTPDFGPPTLHPTAGAIVVGARPPLIAYNVNLQTEDLALAKAIAKKIRASGGGLPSVKAIGVALPSRRLVQVSMNLTNYEETPIQAAFEAVRREAEGRGVQVVGSEVIGLVPHRALVQVSESVLKLERFDQSQVLETRLEKVLAQEGEVVGQSASLPGSGNLGGMVADFLDAVSAGTPTPGGGSVAALAGSLAAALGVMACRIGLPSQQAKHPTKKSSSVNDLERIEQRLLQVSARLKTLVQADAEAYEGVLRAYRLPKTDPSRPDRISASLHAATEVPLETASLACEVAKLLRSVIAQTKSSVSADLKVGLFMARAAIQAGLENVAVNLKVQKNQELISETTKKLRGIKESLEELKGL